VAAPAASATSVVGALPLAGTVPVAAAIAAAPAGAVAGTAAPAAGAPSARCLSASSTASTAAARPYPLPLGGGSPASTAAKSLVYSTRDAAIKSGVTLYHAIAMGPISHMGTCLAIFRHAFIPVMEVPRDTTAAAKRSRESSARVSRWSARSSSPWQVMWSKISANSGMRRSRISHTMYTPLSFLGRCRSIALSSRYILVRERALGLAAECFSAAARDTVSSSASIASKRASDTNSKVVDMSPGCLLPEAFEPPRPPPDPFFDARRRAAGCDRPPPAGPPAPEAPPPPATHAVVPIGPLPAPTTRGCM